MATGTTDVTDESRLLRGQALQDALRWAADKSLSNEDSRYLAASQKLENLNLFYQSQQP